MLIYFLLNAEIQESAVSKILNTGTYIGALLGFIGDQKLKTATKGEEEDNPKKTKTSDPSSEGTDNPKKEKDQSMLAGVIVGYADVWDKICWAVEGNFGSILTKESESSFLKNIFNKSKMFFNINAQAGIFVLDMARIYGMIGINYFSSYYEDKAIYNLHTGGGVMFQPTPRVAIGGEVRYIFGAMYEKFPLRQKMDREMEGAWIFLAKLIFYI